MSTSTSVAKPSRRAACRIETVRVGERVEVSLRSPDPSRYEVWHGTILAVDEIGLRLSATLLRTDYGRFDEEGDRFFPWGAIESVEIRGAERAT